MVNFIKTFRNQVIAQVEKRFSNAEAIAMSVINRGVGLASEVTVTEQKEVEKIIFDVFEKAKLKYPDERVLDPKLVEILTLFKTNWINTLKSTLGHQKSECLLLSAIDRGLGFTEKSIMHPANEMEKKEFEEAEGVLVPLVRKLVEDYQRSISVGR